MANWNPDEPLARMKGERTDANQALHDYALMGAGRSLRKLCDWYSGQSGGKAGAKSGGGPSASTSSPPAQPPTKRLATLEAWSTRYDWQRRVAAWQALQHAREHAKWEERRREWRERAFSLALKLADKAEEMLKFPVLDKSYENNFTVLEPAKWTYNTPPQMLAFADKLARLAAQMDTERRRELSWRDEWIQLLRDGVVTQAEVKEELGDELAQELFNEASIRRGES